MHDNSLVKQLVEPTSTVLDLGCWTAWTWRDIKVKKRVSVDIFPEFYKWEGHHPQDKHPNVLWNLENFPYPFADNSYDIVTALDVIEHLPNSKGFGLMCEMERIAAKRIIIQTPNYFRSNKEHASKNAHNEHRSIWSEGDFMGWKFLEHSDKTQIFCYKDIK